MRLDYIEVENFFNHSHTILDLQEVGSPLLVLGHNGAGKSSLFTDAISFAIFGIVRAEYVDKAIRDTSDEMSVLIRFNLNNQDVEICRKKKRGKSAKLSLSLNGSNVEELLTETQKRIDKMFGLSYNSFLSSIILEQKKSDFFVEQKPDERKKVILEILDVSQYERLEKIAREERANLKSIVKIEEAAFNSIVIKNIEELEQKHKILNNGTKRLREQISKLEKEISEIRSWNQTVLEAKRHKQQIVETNKNAEMMIYRLDSKIVSIKSEIKRLLSIAHPSNDHSGVITHSKSMLLNKEKTLEELTHQYNKEFKTYNLSKLEAIKNHRENVLQPIQKEYDMLLGEKNALEKASDKIEALDTDICPTCEQKVSPEHLNSINSEYKNQLKTNNEKLDDLKKLLDSIQTSLNALQDDKEEWQINGKLSLTVSETEIANLTNEIRIFRSTLNDKIEFQKQYEVADQKRLSLVESLKDCEESKEGFKKQIQPIPDVTIETKDDSTLKLNLENFREQEIKAIKAMATIEVEIESNKNNIERKTVLENSLKENIHKCVLLDKIVIAFSKNGIPSAIIETVLPEIEENTNYFLSNMSHGGLTLKFKTVEVLRNGNEKDTLDLQVFDNKNWRDFETFSGGEQFRVSLAIRLALSKVLARRANIDLQLLVLDEPASSLDQPGREDFVQAISALTQDFSRIVIVSHNNEIKEEFDNRITLISSPNGTKILSKN